MKGGSSNVGIVDVSAEGAVVKTSDATTEALTLNAGQGARLLGISRAHFYRLHSAGQVPLPIHLGNAVRWVRQELEDWLAAGAPSRAQWEAMKKSQKRSCSS